jgi:glutamyl-tRNA synthetase
VDAAALEADDRLVRIVALFKDRCETLVDLANWVKVFYVESVERNAEDYAKHVTPEAHAVLDAFAAAMQAVEWSKEAIAAAIKEVLKAQGVKMPALAMPVRVLTVGTAHTPSVDAVLELLGREKILARLKNR